MVYFGWLSLIQGLITFFYVQLFCAFIVLLWIHLLDRCHYDICYSVKVIYWLLTVAKWDKLFKCAIIICVCQGLKLLCKELTTAKFVCTDLKADWRCFVDSCSRQSDWAHLPEGGKDCWSSLTNSTGWWIMSINQPECIFINLLRTRCSPGS